MTAAVYRSTPSLSVPQTQNTALVFEFNCLYTHDVKKKGKKWQDGFLRYHTFNKRAMVYDVPRNLIGDCHWTGDEPVQEGDELRLERNGVMVEVGDRIGQTETDLSELRKSRKKDSAANTSVAAAPMRPAMRPVNGTVPARGNGQQKHRSLGALLGTPKGPLGKAALPQKSPFEHRHASPGTENEEWEDGRPPKRQRTATAPEWNVTRNSKAGKPAKQAEISLWARKADAVNRKKKISSEPGQQRLGTREVVTLSGDDDVAESRETFLPRFSDDALAPSSPVKDKRKDACKEAARSSSPAFQTQRTLPPARRPKPPTESRTETIKRAQPNSRSTMSPAREDGHANGSPMVPKPASRQTMERSKPAPEPSRPASSKSGPTLRLAASAPKKPMLLCQAQVSKKPNRVPSTSTEPRRSMSPDNANESKRQSRPLSAREALEARLARIDKKGGSTSSARFQPAKAKTPPIEVDSDDGFADDMQDEDALDEDYENAGPEQSSHERSAIELRRLDEMMLPPAARKAPPPPPKLPSPSPPPPEACPLRRVVSESPAAQPSKPKRVPGAPVRYTPTPSPTKQSRQSTPVPAAASKQTSTTNATTKPDVPAKSYKPKKPLQKSVSLNVTSNGTSTVMLSRPFQAPGKAAKPKEPEPPKDIGPWSREAFDLFTWRPPKWDEEKWCVKQGPTPPAGLSGGTALPRNLRDQ